MEAISSDKLLSELTPEEEKTVTNVIKDVLDNLDNEFVTHFFDKYEPLGTELINRYVSGDRTSMDCQVLDVAFGKTTFSNLNYTSKFVFGLVKNLVLPENENEKKMVLICYISTAVAFMFQNPVYQLILKPVV